MKTKPFIAIVLVVALSTGIYLWLNGRNSAVVAEDSFEMPRTVVSSEIATSKAQIQTPLAVPEVPEKPALAQIQTPLSVPEVPEKPAVRSIDMRRFDLLVGIGTLNFAPVLMNPDGTPAEARVVEEIQARTIGRVREKYGLTDQEWEKLLGVTKALVQSDQKFQLEGIEQICAARATFRNIEDFGAALNDSHRKAQLHKENLGREAPEKLGSELFSKIEVHNLNQRPRAPEVVDYATVLVARKADLETEIKRLCGCVLENLKNSTAKECQSPSS